MMQILQPRPNILKNIQFKCALGFVKVLLKSSSCESNLNFAVWLPQDGEAEAGELSEVEEVAEAKVEAETEEVAEATSSTSLEVGANAGAGRGRHWRWRCGGCAKASIFFIFYFSRLDGRWLIY